MAVRLNHIERRTPIIFLIFIFLISIGLLFLPNLLAPKHSGLPPALMSLTLFLFLVCRGIDHVINVSLSFWRNQRAFRILFIPLIMSLFFEMIRYFFHPNYGLYTWITKICLFFLFVLFLIIVFVDYCDGSADKFIKKILGYYFFTTIFMASCAVIVLFLLHLHIVDVADWTNTDLFGQDFAVRNNLEESGNFFSAPLYLTVVDMYSPKIVFT